MLKKKLLTCILEGSEEELKSTLQTISTFPEIDVLGAHSSAVKGMSVISNYVPDLIFISTDLPETSGIEFVKLLRERKIQSEVVYMSDESSLAYLSLQTKPFDFLLRPIQADDITKVLKRLKDKHKKLTLLNKMQLFEKSQQVNVKRTFQQKGGIIILPLDKILFCKAELTKCTLNLINGEKVVLRTNIAQTIATINSEDFIRIGRSYCINRRFLRKLDRRRLKCQLYFDGKTWELPASKGVLNQLEKVNTANIQ